MRVVNLNAPWDFRRWEHASWEPGVPLIHARKGGNEGRIYKPSQVPFTTPEYGLFVVGPRENQSPVKSGKGWISHCSCPCNLIVLQTAGCQPSVFLNFRWKGMVRLVSRKGTGRSTNGSRATGSPSLPSVVSLAAHTRHYLFLIFRLHFKNRILSGLYFGYS